MVCLIRDVNIYEFFNIHFSYDHVIEHFEVSAGKISTLCTDEIRAPLVKEPFKKPGPQVLSLFLLQFKFYFCTESSLFVSGNLVCLIDKRRHYGSLYIVCITYYK